MLLRNSIRLFISQTRSRLIRSARSAPLFQTQTRWISSEPSVEAMESFLLSSTRSNRLTVTEVLSDEIVRIPSVDGIAIGSWVSFENSAKGIVLHFDKSFATVGVVGATRSVCRNMSAELLSETPLAFRIPSVPFNTSEKFSSSKSLTTGVPVVDLLLNQYVKEGMTVGIYGSDPLPVFPSSESIKVVEFPSRKNPPSTGVDLYLDLLRAAKEAMDHKDRFKKTVLVADFRTFENACESIEYQSGHLLPVSGKSLVASVLQLSHGSLSVVAGFNNRKEFQNEAEQSVDIGIDVAGGTVTNLIPLLSRFALKKQPVSGEEMLIARIVEGSRFKQSVVEKEAMKMFVDYWEKEDVESFDTMMRLLPGVAKVVATDCRHGIKYMLLRSLCVLPFNKTSKLNSAAVAKYPEEFVRAVECQAEELLREVENSLDAEGEIHTDLRIAVDSMLYHIRYKFEITNPLV